MFLTAEMYFFLIASNILQARNTKYQRGVFAISADTGL